MVIAVLRISGQVDLNKDIKETMDRLKIQRKYTCTFVEEKDVVRMGMVHFVTSFVAYGEVDKKLMDEIIAKRGQKDSNGKYRGFCRLAPAVGGLKKSSKLNYPRGVLGNNTEIAKLLVRMI
jgi:ribosomal protein L30/L7E